MAMLRKDLDFPEGIGTFLKRAPRSMCLCHFWPSFAPLPHYPHRNPSWHRGPHHAEQSGPSRWTLRVSRRYFRSTSCLTAGCGLFRHVLEASRTPAKPYLNRFMHFCRFDSQSPDANSGMLYLSNLRLPCTPHLCAADGRLRCSRLPWSAPREQPERLLSGAFNSLPPSSYPTTGLIQGM